jgi:hypothetical protein
MKKLYEAADRIEAQMLKDTLEAAGVDAVILGDYLAGGAGELPANIWPAVWIVTDSDFNKAQQLLLKFTKRHNHQQVEGDWRCQKCGEWVEASFDICWNCASPRYQRGMNQE